MLSLVFVPAIFILMDDLGALIWRFGRKLLANSGENEHPPGDHAGGHKPPPMAHSPRPRTGRSRPARICATE